jgi:ATP-binding cassette, subfamily G (WHITE), member 2, PDR
MFDRPLFLSEGRCLYFGDFGRRAETLTAYFERYGARKSGPEENPAEWLLTITSNAANPTRVVDWAEVWTRSDESANIKNEISEMKEKLSKTTLDAAPTTSSGKYATPAIYQLFVVTKRTLQHDWRTPSFLWSKALSTLGMVGNFKCFTKQMSPLTYRHLSMAPLSGNQKRHFKGSRIKYYPSLSSWQSFQPRCSLLWRGLWRIAPLYEIRERPSRIFSWSVFIVSNIIAELPSKTPMAVLVFVVWYYPPGLYKNALVTDQLNSRGGLTFLLFWSFMTFSSNFSQMVMTIMPNAPTGVNIATLLYMLSLLFSG